MSERPEIKPTVGRTVLYNDGFNVRMAFIISVADAEAGLVTLRILVPMEYGDDYEVEAFHSVCGEQGHWYWPPRS